MKSFKGRTVLSGAIWYDRTELVQHILSYDYKAVR